MNKKLLSCMISLSLGATSISGQAAGCPSNIDRLPPEQRASLPENCRIPDESDSLWWWVGGGATLAALGVAVAAGGGGDGDDDDDNDFDDYDDYIEYYDRYGNWPTNTPQNIIDRWNNFNNAGNTSNVESNTENANLDRFSTHLNSAGTDVTPFTFNHSNGTLSVDANSRTSGNNQYTSRVTGQGITVNQVTGITTTAQNDATALNITGSQARINIAGNLAASSDATIIELNGTGSTLDLAASSKVNVQSGADAINIEGANTTVAVKGSLTVSGWDSTGIKLEGPQSKLTIADSAQITVSSLNGTWRDDDVIASAFDVDGSNFQVIQDSQNFVVGANATGIDAEANAGGSVLQRGSMTINGSGATGIRIESEYSSGGLSAINSGTLKVSAAGTGMYAEGAGATVVNAGKITVNNSGSALTAARGARAINRGTITLTADNGVASGTLTALRGTGNSTLINDSHGVIHINASGAEPFTTTTSNDRIVNSGKIYVNGNDATQQYTINNYTVGTQNITRVGALYGQNLNLADVQVDTDFTRQTSETSVTLDDVFVGNNLNGSGNIQSASVVWQAKGVQDAQGNVDIVMSKKRYDKLVSNADLQSAAKALESGYHSSALYSSLNQTSVQGLNQAISQISGRNIGLALRQARTLTNRFERMADNTLKTPGGLGFNIIDKHNPQAELGNKGHYDMVALTQDFSIDRQQFTLRYGLARIEGGNNKSADGVDDGYSQFFGLGHQYPLGEWQWKNQLDASLHQLDTSRHIRYQGVNRQAAAHSEQQELSFTSTLGKRLTLSQELTLEPYAGTKMRWHHADAVQEQRAGEWNLNLDARDKTAIDVLAGVRLSWQSENGLHLNASLEAGPNVYYQEQTGYALLNSAPGVRFKNASAQREKITSNAQIGASWRTGNTSLGLNTWHWQEDSQKDKGLLFRLNYQF
ncbi:TPA: autotransporter domain-containing protein [Klebsiella oxytoca]|nr:autotransporter domain-containing protein [Klebsiella oxytoca]